MMDEPQIPRTYTVIRVYESSNPDPITFRSGEVVQVGQTFTEDPDWQNWVKCENAEGKQGWTPIQLVRIEGEWATALSDYTAHELTVAIGETVLVRQILNGWAWGETAQGELGWVPVRNLERTGDSGST